MTHGVKMSIICVIDKTIWYIFISIKFYTQWTEKLRNKREDLEITVKY